MKVTESMVTLTDAITVRWGAVKTLKVLNEKVLFLLQDNVILEVSGLPAKMVDAVFIAYARYLREHQLAGV